jgi:DNA-nicking Smr family endonuclease
MPGRPPDDDADRRASGRGDASREPRFAELLSDVRPIDDGPERLRPARGQPVAPKSAARGKSQQHAFRWPDPSDRHRATAPGVSDAVLLRLTRGDPAPEERIDLHGVRREGVARLLDRRFASARARGLRCLLVIHGRGTRSAGGESVLRERMPDWLSREPVAAHVLAFASAPERLGGAGATLVRLRRH